MLIDRDLLAAFSAFSQTLNFTHAARQVGLMLRFVELGLGVAMVNGICRLPAGVVSRPLGELGSVTYRLVRRRGAQPSAAVDRLAGLIRECGKRPG